MGNLLNPVSKNKFETLKIIVKITLEHNIQIFLSIEKEDKKNKNNEILPFGSDDKNNSNQFLELRSNSTTAHSLQW